MNIPEQFIKPFPGYEEVFYEDIEGHKKHFLPICSINLQCIFPDQDEWLHIVSAKEIHEGCVGADTTEYHTHYSKEDMIGFNVIDGKYKFEAEWKYFAIEQKDDTEDSYEVDSLEDAYQQNEKDYQSRKQFYFNHGMIYPYSSFGEAFTSAETLKQDYEDKKAAGWGLGFPEVNGIIDDIAFMSDEAREYIETYNESLDELLKFESTNLINIPKKLNGDVFTYIGSLTGYYFQAFGADCVYLFYDQDLKKAVICFEYS
ncbi:siderophore biosynthesis protein [Paenibacillus filicis]|uniref:Siderophore biosynthesis protein n=1 Tax=Paenibacillus filicis TaxID=669464 RepID=A0ABU9DGA1_9BACL